LKGAADGFVKQYLLSDMIWPDLKLKLFERFRCQLSIWVKFDMKRNLAQTATETVRDFYNRCVSYQYLLCDDYSETVLDNEIMVNFMLGMNKNILAAIKQRLPSTELGTCSSHVFTNSETMNNKIYICYCS
jgi:hypothetical protein